MYPDKSKGYFYLALVYSYLNDIKKAEENFKKAIEKDKNDPFIFIKYGEFKLKNFEIEAATSLFNKASQKQRDFGLLLFNTGKLNEILGKNNLAERFYKRILPDSAYSITGYVALGELYSRYGSYKKAEEFLLKAQAKLPYSPILNIALGDLYAEKYLQLQAKPEWAKKTISYYDNAIKLYQDYTCYQKKAVFFINILQNYYKGLEASAFTKNKYLTSYSTIKNYATDSIKKYLDLSKENNPFTYDIKVSYAKYYKLIGQKDSVLKILSDFETIENNKISLYYSAKVYEILEEYPKGLKSYKKLLKLVPKYTDLYENIFDLYIKIGNVKEIGKIYNKQTICKSSSFLNYKYGTTQEENAKQRQFISKAIGITRQFHYSKIAIENYNFQKYKQNKRYTNDDVWEIERIKTIENKWVKFKIKEKFGIMIMTGKIIIPANFENINYKKDNVFECFKNGDVVSLEVNVNDSVLTNN